MNKLFEHLAASQTDALHGRIIGTQLGIVTNVADPLELNRVQVTTSDKGGLTSSDWCFVLTNKGITSPVPLLGDTCVISYLDGDAHHPIVLGIIHNALNVPVPDGHHVVLQPDQTFSCNVDATWIVASKDSITLSQGGATLMLKDGDVTINGRSIAVVGAAVSGGRNVISRGY